MNKKNFAVVLAVLAYVLVGALNVDLMAQTKKKSEVLAEKAALAEQEKLAAKRAALREKAIQVLKGREWAVYVTVEPAAGKSPAVIKTDTLIFTERTVLSKDLTAQGYSKNGSNYSLSAADNGIATWETMQLNENGQDIAFLRGELNINSGSMQGAIIYRPSKGKEIAQAYSTIKPQDVTAEPTAVSTPEKTEGTAKSKKKGKK